MINRKVNTTDTKDILDMYYNKHSDLCCYSLSDWHIPACVLCDTGVKKEKYLLLPGIHWMVALFEQLPSSFLRSSIQVAKCPKGSDTTAGVST